MESTEYETAEQAAWTEYETAQEAENAAWTAYLRAAAVKRNAYEAWETRYSTSVNSGSVGDLVT